MTGVSVPSAEAVTGSSAPGMPGPGVQWIRLAFVDVFGASSSMLVPAGSWHEVLTNGVMFDGSAIEGRARLIESDMLLKPVPGSLLELGPGVSRAVCEVLGRGGQPWAGDPRTALRLVVERYGELAGGWTATAELELYLLHDGLQPADRGGYFVDPDGRGGEVMRAAGARLSGHGVPVISCHHEAGPGQYELDLGPLAPLALADAIVLAKEALRHEAAQRGLVATFMPRPLEGEPGSGLHVHQRVPGLLDGTELTPDGRAYVGGQLAHSPALSALFAPTVNSYKRLHSTFEAPGTVMWSHHHRAALVRVGSLGIEHRGADPSANPYLLVAGLLLAGVDGLESDADPGPAQDESAGGFDTRIEVRYEPLPRTLDDALDALLRDEVLLDGLDPVLVERLVDGRRAEADEYRRHVTSWEHRQYLQGA
jgi:glutamine synthetase